MTNFETIKNADLEQLGHFLCERVEAEFYKTHSDNEWACGMCPMVARCDIGQNGWIDWLRSEK